MKRMIASILMIVILVLLMVPTVFAKICADPTIDSIPLWNADENWEGDTAGFELDTENQVEGSGCVSVHLRDKATENDKQIAYVYFPAVNATGMTALEFDLYISDTAALDRLEQNTWLGKIDLASVNDENPSEMGFLLSKMIAQMKENGLVAGWNHVVILLDSMVDSDDNFDITAINRLRIYWMPMLDCPEDWVMKLDNFVLTNRRGSAPGYHNPSEGYFSCGADGHSAKCGKCGEYVGNMNPHVFDGWVVRQAPTETEDGLQYRECMMCDYSETQSIPKTGSQITDDDDTNKQNQQNTTDTPDDSAPGCSGAIGGAWSIPAVLSLAGWAIRKKQK